MARPPATDVNLAYAALTITVFTAMYHPAPARLFFPWLAANVVISVAMAARNVWRRATFVAVLALALLLCVLALTSHGTLETSPLVWGVPLALYPVARHEAPAWGVVGLAAILVVTMVCLGPFPDWAPMRDRAGWFGGAAAASFLIARRRRHITAEGATVARPEAGPATS